MAKSAILEPMKNWHWLAIGILIGALLILGWRWFSYRDESVHYHANFAVYVNGEREAFENPLYYEEVATCAEAHNSPAARAHLHDEVSDVVHIEDEAVTWGQFFENLGWSINSQAIKTSENLYVDGQGGELSLILNGQPADDVAGRVIQNRDKLLVSYGTGDTKTQYQSIADTAEDYNQRDDPPACAGSENGPGARWRYLLF